MSSSAPPVQLQPSPRRRPEQALTLRSVQRFSLSALRLALMLCCLPPPAARAQSIFVPEGDPQVSMDDVLGNALQDGICFLREARERANGSDQGAGKRGLLPYIGPSGRDEFIATGFSGNGMTFGTLAAMMARDWITGRPDPWQGIFDPGRVELSAAGAYLSENRDFPLHMIRDRLGTAKGMDGELQPGQGRILKHDGHRGAVCKGTDGNEHRLSAVCPHMGCIVAWNESANTWDCPCHGSRFMADGTVIAGPAQSNLEPLSTPDRNVSAHEYSQTS